MNRRKVTEGKRFEGEKKRGFIGDKKRGKEARREKRERD